MMNKFLIYRLILLLKLTLVLLRCYTGNLGNNSILTAADELIPILTITGI